MLTKTIAFSGFIALFNLLLIVAMIIFGRQSPPLQLLFIGQNGRFHLYDVVRNVSRESSSDLKQVLIINDNVQWLPGQTLGFLGMTRGITGEIYLLDVRRKALSHYQVENFNHREVVWSPDGQRVAFTDPNNTQVYISEHPDLFYRITERAGLYGELAWSPDGTQLALSVFQGGLFHLALLDLQTQELSVFDVQDSSAILPQWSPDGRALLFALSRANDVEIHQWDVRQKKLEQVTSFPGLASHPAWSPDGKQIAFVLSDDISQTIAVIDSDGGNLRRLMRTPHLYTSLIWSSDSRWLAFVNRAGLDSTLYVQSVINLDQPALRVGTIPRYSPVIWRG